MVKGMNRIKEKINNFIDALPFLVLQLIPPVILVVMLWIMYQISVSDLPDWVKFVLLYKR